MRAWGHTVLVAPMLGAYDGSRDNNFTVLRILFAWLVLWGHSYAVTGGVVANPLKSVLQGSTWIGEIAVSGFFVISGFLVAASFVRRGSIDYLVSRVLRIYPALVVCVLLTVFCLGPALGTLSTETYFSKTQTWSYLSNLYAVLPMEFMLPGVYENQFRGGVNGSLWTLPVEVSCYLLLLLAGVLGLLRSKMLINMTLVCIVLFAFSFFADIPLVGRFPKWSGPSLYFVLGVAFYANRDALPLSVPLALFSAFLAYTSFGEAWFAYVFPPALTYLVFFLAYRTPHLPVDRYLGDPSYGIYIYAWPVQQAFVLWFPEEGPYFNTVFASLVVFVLAMASWRLVEMPALALKQRVLSKTKET